METLLQTKNLMQPKKNRLVTQLNITYYCNTSCSYCFIENFRGYVDNMTYSNFLKVLDWLEKNNVMSFNLLGGEPTTHPQVNEFIDEAHKRGFKVGVFSNALFLESFKKSIPKVSHFLINYNARNFYSERMYQLMHDNMDLIKKNDIYMKLAFNITEQTDSCQYIIDACKKYNINGVNMDLIIPNALKSNYFIDENYLADKRELILGFVNDFKKNNIKVKITRPLPRCMFTREEVDYLKKKGIIHFECGAGKSVLTINTDLSVFPCLSLFYKGPRITDLESIDAYEKFYDESIKELKWEKQLYEKCKSCKYFIRKNCQGACLCRKCKQFHTQRTNSSIIYSQYQTIEINNLIKSSNEAIETLKGIFGNMKKKITIYVFDNKDDLAYYSGVYYFPKWVRGFASYNLTYYQYSNAKINRITHEMCHLFIQYFSKNKIPTWLNEGFCEFVNFDEDNKEKLIELMKTKELLPFEKLYDCGKMSLLKYDESHLDNNICYNQSHNFVRYLINRFSLDNILKLIVNEYCDFYNYFFVITNEDFFKVEKEWKELLSNIIVC